MIRLEQLEKAMRPQFIWDRTGKPLQTSETFEGAKDLARMIFVGLADMHGFEPSSVQDYLEMTYDSHRNKIQAFRHNLREARRRAEQGVIKDIEDPIQKFHYKVMLCLNAIKLTHNSFAFLKLENYIEHD